MNGDERRDQTETASARAPLLGVALIVLAIGAALTLTADPTSVPDPPRAAISAPSAAPTSVPDAAAAPPRATSVPLLVAAAASLSGVMQDIATAFRAETGIDARMNFAASNTLARQIVEGARVDVFISADPAQMDAVERAGRIVDGSRINLLGNSLMIIIGDGRGRGLPLQFRPPDLANPNVRRVALGDPAAVPVGVYARRWLENIGLWKEVAPKVVPLPSSPAVVAAVREGRAEIGIVYATDDRRRGGAHIVDGDDAPRIVYPAAACVGDSGADAVRFLNFLRTPAARDLFRAAGFVHLPH